jgi:pimeloyl-ACP methyl ester carboxylesterase
MGREFFTCVDGARVRVVEDGDPHAFVTVVLVHCYALDHGEWDRLLPELARSCDVPVRVLRYDHRGSGESESVTPDTATLAQLGDDLAELISQRVPTGPLVLVGHSMGGMAIMAMAERHPELTADRVAGVAFVSTACAGMDGMSFGLPAMVAAAVHRLERAGVRLLSAARRPVLTRHPWFLVPFVWWLGFGEAASSELIWHVAQMMATARPVTLLLFRPDFDVHDRREALANLAGSAATVLVGDRDRVTPPRCGAEIAQRLPGSRLVVLEGAGHMVPQERPAELAAAVTTLVRAALAPTITEVAS